MIFLFNVYSLLLNTVLCNEYCSRSSESEVETCSIPTHHPTTDVFQKIKENIENAMKQHAPCPQEKCLCHSALIKADLASFSNGIFAQDINNAIPRGTLYQVIDQRLYRQKECMFPSRCSGIEHFLLKIIKKLPNIEFVVNTRDWPQVSRYSSKIPVFSFSKTKDYLDITYPAWTFWEGGPAIQIYPRGIGRFDVMRKNLIAESERIPWRDKTDKAFFRGSRTSAERDPLIRLSRNSPDLVDAQYTKNQAWKSDADTLYSPPAEEVSFEAHCQYKYLFNYRGVAASFRLKHLFLCRSLVFHAGHEWIEFFYPQLKPWVHYVPVPAGATEHELRELILFARENDDLVKEIAERGFQFIRDNLRLKDVLCYWKKLLLSYAKLLRFPVQKRENLIEIK